jgi:prepilin-type N-terminal cleavage/methylation domain-containing protein
VNRKAFTLMEVLVAVMLIAVIGATLLKVSSNNSFLMGYFQQKSHQNSLYSLFVLNSSKEYDKKSLFLDEVLKNYKINDDDIRQYFKNFKITYKERVVDTLSLFGGDENSSVDGEEMMEMAQDDEGNESNASGMVDIIRVDLIGEKSGYFFYRFEPQ